MSYRISSVTASLTLLLASIEKVIETANGPAWLIRIDIISADEHCVGYLA
jgi:hypothetical protein